MFSVAYELESLTCVSHTFIVIWRVRRLYREQHTLPKYTGAPSNLFSRLSRRAVDTVVVMVCVYAATARIPSANSKRNDEI